MKTFTNERGNEIKIDVNEKVIDEVDGIFISIEGPHSRSENHITRIEAQILLDELKLALG